MYVTLLVSWRDWLPAFLLLVQGDFHLPSSNSKIKKRPSVLSSSLPSLLWSFVLIISNTNSFSLKSSVHCLVCQVHVLIFPSVCYALRYFLIPWHVYLPNPGVLMGCFSAVPVYPRKPAAGLRPWEGSMLQLWMWIVREKSWLHCCASSMCRWLFSYRRNA